MDIRSYWSAVIAQNAEAMQTFFHADAVVNWHNTNERFSVREFLLANCRYPGQWSGEVERVERCGDTVVTVTRVRSPEASFHAVSCFRILNDKIARLDEYWGDDGESPQWRKELHLGTPISKEAQHE